MSTGQIVVDLLARTGSFETDLNRASKSAAKRAKEIDDAVSKAGVAIGASLAAAGASAVYFGKQLIDGLDALNDVKDATGASIENISALEDVAVRTGTSLDNVSGILVKFNDVLKETDGKNAASKILKEIGLNAQELKKLDPAEALRQTAVAFDQYADNGDKARYFQELFGKSVKEAAPFLKDLAEQTELVGKATTEQAQKAEDFNKQLFALQKSAIDAGRALLQELLPPIMRVIQEMNRGVKTFGSFWGAAVEIGAKTSPFASWSDNAKSAADQVSKLEAEVAKLETRSKAPSVSENAGGAAFVGPRGSSPSALGSRLTAARKELDDARKLKQYFDGLIYDDAARKSAGLENAGFDKPALSGSATVKAPKTSSAGSKESELQRYIEGLEKQLQKVKELTNAEKLLDDVRTGHLKLQRGESIEAAMAAAKQLDAAQAMAEYTKLSNAAADERTATLLKSALAEEEQVKSLTDGNKSLKEEIELIGKNAEAQAAIEAARISSTIALKEQDLARKKGTESYEREKDAIQAQIDLLNERKDLVTQKGVAEKLADDAKKTDEFARDVGASFESSFEKAIIGGEKLSDVLKGLGKDILGLTLRNSITGPLAKGIGDAVGGIDIIGTIGKFFGGFFADGGDPPVGKASVVGENGPEWFVPRTAGTIIPNHALGGGGAPVTVQQYFTVGDVATKAMVREAVAGSQRQSAAALSRSRRYGGAFAE